MGLDSLIPWTVICLLMTSSPSVWITVCGSEESNTPVPTKVLPTSDGQLASTVSPVPRTNVSRSGWKLVSKSSATKKTPAVISVRSCIPSERCDSLPFGLKGTGVTAKSSAKSEPRDTRIASRDKASQELRRSDKSADSKSTQRNSTVTILALVDLSGGSTREHLDGVSLLETAQTALNQVNHQQIIPGFRIELIVNDSKCDSGAGVDAFFHAIYKRKERLMNPFIMLLGPHCSHVTETVASVTSYWNIVQISHAATSAALSDRQKYPFFFRTAAAESTHNAARVAFLRQFGWDTVSVIAQNEDEYTLVVNDLCALLDDANTTVSNLLTFSPSEFEDQLETLSTRDARIIIGSFSPAMAVPIFCEVYKRSLYGGDHVWILPGSVFHAAKWFQSLPTGLEVNATCTARDLKTATEGVFFVKTYPHPVNISDATFHSHQQIPDMPSSEFHGEIYDAVWTMALALRGLQLELERDTGNGSSRTKKESLADFDYNRKDMAETLMHQIASLRFQGASGLVSFMGANRIGTTALFQIQNGIPRQIGLFHPDMGLDVNCHECAAVHWASGHVPVATRIIKYRINTVDPAAFYTMTLLAVLGIVLALICLSFNLAKRKLKYIKLSSPKLNNIAIVGSVLVYGAVFLLGIDHATLVHESYYPIVCTGRAYFLSAGFSLAFGAMFTKTFRVHRIFSRRNSLIKNKLLADTQLIGLILVLLLMDTLVMGIWAGLDPMQRHLRNLTMVVSPVDRSVVYQPQVEVCRSHYSSMWLGILYVSKGLMLVGGLYMAWETRNVAIPALNDSPYIGMNVYNVVITSVTVVFCDSLLSDRTTLAYVVVATLILTSTTTALCLLFLPKFHAVWRHGGDESNPIDHSTGLKVEFNTRRMVVDDRKELLCRAEIMNRVYLRDIANLDADISRLERLLAKEELNSTGPSMEMLDHYNSAIQAEVTQLYAMLEQDEDDSASLKDPPSRVKQAAYSRSCISLCDSRPSTSPPPSMSATKPRRSKEMNNIQRESGNSWGSASCIIHKRNVVAAKRNKPLKQSSLITLLQLNVDIESEASIKTNNHRPCVYQLVDRSLIGMPGDHQTPSTNASPGPQSAGGINRDVVFTFCL